MQVNLCFRVWLQWCVKMSPWEQRMATISASLMRFFIPNCLVAHIAHCSLLCAQLAFHTKCTPTRTVQTSGIGVLRVILSCLALLVCHPHKQERHWFYEDSEQPHLTRGGEDVWKIFWKTANDGITYWMGFFYNAGLLAFQLGWS